MAEYYTLITNAGLIKEAASHTEGHGALELKEFAIGDGAGFMYDPDGNETELKRELYRTAVNRVYIDPNHKNQLIVEGVIPASVGPFTIREVGVFDAAGDMFALGKYPQTYKPTIQSGAGKDLYIRMVLQFSSTPNVNLIIDPNVVMVSASNIDEFIKESVADHELGEDAHFGAFQGLQEAEGLPPTGIHNQYFTGDITDYGDLTGSKPFAAESVPMRRCDMARGGFNYDYEGLTL